MESGSSRVVACLLVLLAVPSPIIASDPQIPRPLLIDDAYQLRDTIEDAHPDPYVNGGGKVAFHRRFRELLGRIPEDGMTGLDFLDLVQPFVAAVGDSHTAVIGAPGEATPVSLPLGFRIVDGHLVVDRVARQERAGLLGARLVAVEGVPLEKLIARQGRMRGSENRYGRMAIMTLRTLATREGVKQLVPEWEGGEALEVELLPTAGAAIHVALELLDEPPADWVTPPSRVVMPSTVDSDVAYAFLDAERTTALLVVSDLMRYREGCELWFADGLEQAEIMTRAAHQHFHGTAGPEARSELLAAIPAATPVLVELVEAMEAAGTRNLIVDLRGNTGGNSAMREILVYLLFGEEAMRSLDNGYQIVKLSRLLREQYEAYALDEVNEGRSLPLRSSDYDFSEEAAYLAPPTGEVSPAADPFLAGSPTFWEVHETKRFHRPRWSPARVVVLSSPTTFSSGFNVLTGLRDLGAVVVGTPSAQAGNSFGDMLVFSLENSGIQAAVSFKMNVAFPDDPELGRCLRPEHPLTYDRLAASGFDPNAEVLLALEVLGAPASE